MKSHHFYFVILLFIGLCHSVSQASSCTDRGRFPSNEDNECRGYVMCLKGGITNFTQYELTCPQGSVYSHLEQQCTNTTSYQCYPTFNCTILGNFENPASENCSSYISCAQGITEIATARLIQCPPNTIFNSTAGECLDSNQATCVHYDNNTIIDQPAFDNNTEINHRASSDSVSNNVKSTLLLLSTIMIFY